MTKHPAKTRFITNRIALLVLVAVLGSGVAFPTSSPAHIRDGKGLFFQGETRTKSDPRPVRDQESDPLNLLFMGGQHPSLSGRGGRQICNTITNETPSCIKHVLELHDRLGTDCALTAGPAAIIRSPTDPFIPTGASLSKANSTACLFNQRHVRAFSDGTHGHPIGNAEWMIGAVHKEESIKVSCGERRFSPRSRCSIDVTRHKITDSWEAAEAETVDEIEKDRKEAVLGDLIGGDEAPEPGHCVYRDALVVPGSAGRFKTFFSDGRMSRVSMKHHDLTKPLGQQCIGG